MGKPSVRLSDIELNLPNGFHDAKITAIRRDLSAELVDIHLKVLVGLPDDEPARQNEYRGGLLRFRGAKIVILEEPSIAADTRYAVLRERTGEALARAVDDVLALAAGAVSR